MTRLIEPHELQLSSFTADDCLKAFSNVKWTPTRRRMLWIHYFQPDLCVSAALMAELMGWSNLATANNNYGRMAGCIGRELGLDVNSLCCKSSVLATMECPNHGEWLWTLRPAVTEAVGIFEKRGLLDFH